LKKNFIFFSCKIVKILAIKNPNPGAGSKDQKTGRDRCKNGTGYFIISFNSFLCNKKSADIGTSGNDTERIFFFSCEVKKIFPSKPRRRIERSKN
jgi:hypothetical protein